MLLVMQDDGRHVRVGVLEVLEGAGVRDGLVEVVNGTFLAVRHHIV